MSDKAQVIKVPPEAHSLVQKLYEEIVKLANERSELLHRYAIDRQAVETKYAPLSADLIGRINEAKIKGSMAICEACGVPYDPACGYSVDAQYLEHGVAFVVVLSREDGARFDNLAHEKIPVGTLLN
jgi:hypothetical protein